MQRQARDTNLHSGAVYSRGVWWMLGKKIDETICSARPGPTWLAQCQSLQPLPQSCNAVTTRDNANMICARPLIAAHSVGLTPSAMANRPNGKLIPRAVLAPIRRGSRWFIIWSSHHLNKTFRVKSVGTMPVGRIPMDPHGSTGGFEALHALCQQAGDQACEHVA